MGVQLKELISQILLDGEDAKTITISKEKNSVFNLGLIGYQLYQCQREPKSPVNPRVKERVEEDLKSIKCPRLRRCLDGMLQFEEDKRFSFKEAIESLLGEQCREIRGIQEFERDYFPLTESDRTQILGISKSLQNSRYLVTARRNCQSYLLVEQVVHSERQEM